MATSSSRSCRSSTWGALPLTPAPLPRRPRRPASRRPGAGCPGRSPCSARSAATSWHHWLYWAALHEGERVFGPEDVQQELRIGERAAQVDILVIAGGRLRRQELPVIGRPGLLVRRRLEVSLDRTRNAVRAWDSGAAARRRRSSCRGSRAAARAGRLARRPSSRTRRRPRPGRRPRSMSRQ